MHTHPLAPPPSLALHARPHRPSRMPGRPRPRRTFAPVAPGVRTSTSLSHTHTHTITHHFSAVPRIDPAETPMGIARVPCPWLRPRNNDHVARTGGRRGDATRISRPRHHNQHTAVAKCERTRVCTASVLRASAATQSACHTLACRAPPSLPLSSHHRPRSPWRRPTRNGTARRNAWIDGSARTERCTSHHTHFTA